jgi:hypothetical protein
MCAGVKKRRIGTTPVSTPRNCDASRSSRATAFEQALLDVGHTTKAGKAHGEVKGGLRLPVALFLVPGEGLLQRRPASEPLVDCSREQLGVAQAVTDAKTRDRIHDESGVAGERPSRAVCRADDVREVVRTTGWPDLDGAACALAQAPG